MQQRAGLARALAIEPQVLIMDEPFASLDAQTRDLLQLELLRIWEQRPTAAMVFVTHSIDEAVLMGDRIVILGGQPGHVRDIVDVGIGRPRDRGGLDSERFRVVRDHVWTMVMQSPAGRTGPRADRPPLVTSTRRVPGRSRAEMRSVLAATKTAAALTALSAAVCALAACGGSSRRRHRELLRSRPSPSARRACRR